jgi:hypothetical protein
MSNSACLKGAATLFFNLSSNSDARSSTKATDPCRRPGGAFGKAAPRSPASRSRRAGVARGAPGRPVGDRRPGSQVTDLAPQLGRGGCRDMACGLVGPGRIAILREGSEPLRVEAAKFTPPRRLRIVAPPGGRRYGPLGRGGRGLPGQRPSTTRSWSPSRRGRSTYSPAAASSSASAGREREFDAFGGRAARPVKYVAAIRALRREDTASFAGGFVSFDSVRVYPKSLRARSKGRRSQEAIGGTVVERAAIVGPSNLRHSYRRSVAV